MYFYLKFLMICINFGIIIKIIFGVNKFNFIYLFNFLFEIFFFIIDVFRLLLSVLVIYI